MFNILYLIVGLPFLFEKGDKSNHLYAITLAKFFMITILIFLGQRQAQILYIKVAYHLQLLSIVLISFSFGDIQNLGEMPSKGVIPATTLLTDTFCAMLLPMCLLEVAWLNVPMSCFY